jgi:hypothetical protein
MLLLPRHLKLTTNILSDERTGMSFLPAKSFSRPSIQELMTIRYCLRCETFKSLGPGACIYIPQDGVAKLYPQTLGSNFVASCDSQGYGGGLRTASMLLLIYINPIRTSQETHHISAIKPNRLMLFGERGSVYCENHMEHYFSIS